MKIYAGNLSYDVTEDELQEVFEAFGPVDSVAIIMDKYSGRSKGFGFVEMSSDADAKSAIEELNGTELQGRTMTVNEARPRTEHRRDRDRRGGRGGGRGGGRSGGGRDRRY